MNVILFQRNDVFWVRYSYEGEQIRKSLRTKNRTIAKRKAQQIEKEIIIGNHQAGEVKKPLEDFLSEYFEYATNHKSRRTVNTDRCSIDGFLQFKKIKFLNDITKKQIEDFKNHLLKQNLKATTVNIRLRHLSSILGMATNWGYIHSNPFKGITLLKVDKSPVDRIK